MLKPRPAQQFLRGRASLSNPNVADEYNAAADAQPLASMAYALRRQTMGIKNYSI
jgi:hypothetical protein